MGSKHSVEAERSQVAAAANNNNNNSETKGLLRPRESIPQEKRCDKDDFTRDYKVVKQVMGGSAGHGLSNIFMVVKNKEQRPLDEDAEVKTDADESDNGDGNDVYVLQVIDMKSVAPEQRKSMKKEIQSLKQIQHQNILRVFEVYDATRKNNTIAMVTELCSGSHLHSSTPYPENRVRKIVVVLLDALGYLHQRGFFHNNLNTENIMFEDDSQDAKVKITYAGVSSSYSSTNEFAVSSPDWDQHGKDIYSVGMIAYKLLAGGKEPPTDMDTQLVAPNTNLFGGRRWKRISISRNAKMFIEKCFHLDSRKQFTVEQATQHPWVTQERVYRTIAARPVGETNEAAFSTTSNGSNAMTSSSASGNSDGSGATPLCTGESVVPVAVSLSAEKYNLEVMSKIGINDGSSQNEPTPGDVAEKATEPLSMEVVPDEESLANGSVYFDSADEGSLTNEPVPEAVIEPIVEPLHMDINDEHTLPDETMLIDHSKGAPGYVAEKATEPLSLEVSDEESLANGSVRFDSADEGSLTNEPVPEAVSVPIVDPLHADINDEQTLPDETMSRDHSEDATEPIPIVVHIEGSVPDEVSSEDRGEPVTLSPPIAMPVEKSLPKEPTFAEVSNDETGPLPMDLPPAPGDLSEAHKSKEEYGERSSIPYTSIPAEFLDLHEAFQQAETENGGAVTVEDLKARLKIKYTEDEVNSWFQGGKYDDSRNLKYTEFLSAAIRNRRKIEIRRVEEAFQAIDKGKRGFVTVGNLRAVLGTNNSENIEMLIKAADTRRDGKITYENFEEVVRHWLGSE